MIKKEMYDFMIDINGFFPTFEVTKQKAILWQSVLYFVKAKDFKTSLIEYVKNEIYPPTVASLLNYWCGNYYEKSKDRSGD